MTTWHFFPIKYHQNPVTNHKTQQVFKPFKIERPKDGGVLKQSVGKYNQLVKKSQLFSNTIMKSKHYI